MSDGDVGGVFTLLVLLAVLGFIPAAIAKQKGRAFGQWWFYGFIFFPIAIVHSALLEPVANEDQRKRLASVNGSVATADAIARFAQLHKDGLLTADEFANKKRQLLADDAAISGNTGGSNA